MKRYTVGIDLGTSNTVVAYGEAGSEDIRVFDVDQLVGLGEVAARPLLPSLRYHAAAGELDPGDLHLPWQAAGHKDAQPVVIGRLARTLGAHHVQSHHTRLEIEDFNRQRIALLRPGPQRQYLFLGWCRGGGKFV